MSPASGTVSRGSRMSRQDGATIVAPSSCGRWVSRSALESARGRIRPKLKCTRTTLRPLGSAWARPGWPAPGSRVLLSRWRTRSPSRSGHRRPCQGAPAGTPYPARRPQVSLLPRLPRPFHQRQRCLERFLLELRPGQRRRPRPLPTYYQRETRQHRGSQAPQHW
jgi:hypothetical protein